MTEFVLDQVDNPHPKMLAGAIEARRRAKAIGGKEATYYLVGYITAMADATGQPVEAINAWIDRHDGETSYVGGTAGWVDGLQIGRK